MGFVCILAKLEILYFQKKTFFQKSTESTDFSLAIVILNGQIKQTIQRLNRWIRWIFEKK